MSNPPVPRHLRFLRGNPGKRPLWPEPEPARESRCPDPPPFVVGYAADEWHRVAPELHRLGLLTIIDTAVLAAYCVAYSRWRQAEEALTHMAEKDESTKALTIKTVDGNPRVNPLVRIARAAAADMLRFAGEFGMTAVARTRLVGGISCQPPGGGKFGDLIA